MTTPAATPVTPRPAASIVIIRDGRDGLETFMLVRNTGANMAFSGATVFPGGKVDAADGEPHWREIAPPAGERPDHPYWIAGVRETFEEAGLLLARTRGGAAVSSQLADTLLERERTSRLSGTPVAFADLVRGAGLTLALDQMVHFGHWITPEWLPKRFDTHFFLIGAPEGQHGLFDDAESSEGFWISPADAVRQAETGERTLVDVTRFSLELLATWPTVAHAIEAARKREIVTISPRMEKAEGGAWMRIPENSGYVSSAIFVRHR